MAINRFSNSELLWLPNCMGLSETGECFWLNVSICEGEKCAFKHTSAEYDSSHIKSFQRLASLSDSKQTTIANKYYGGKKPWIKE